MSAPPHTTTLDDLLEWERGAGFGMRPGCCYPASPGVTAGQVENLLRASGLWHRVISKPPRLGSSVRWEVEAEPGRWYPCELGGTAKIRFTRDGAIELATLDQRIERLR